MGRLAALDTPGRIAVLAGLLVAAGTPPAGARTAVADPGSQPGASVALEASCGDGQPDPGEQCDDGNLSDEDCCTSTCRFAGQLTVIEELVPYEQSYLSADGTTLGGSMQVDGLGMVAFYWRPETGATFLTPDPPMESTLRGLSEDGSVRVVTVFPGGTPAIGRWDDDGLEVIGALPGEQIGRAADVSADGDVIVGLSQADPLATIRSVRWTADAGVVQIPPHEPGTDWSVANGVSSDGLVLVGRWDALPFWWSEQAGLDVLAQEGSAHRVSADGSTVLLHVPGDAALRWRGGEIEPLPDLPDGDRLFLYADDLSADGTRIVGESSGPPVLWIDDAPPSPLFACDADMLDWTLQSAAAISDDGRVVVGRAYSSEVGSVAYLLRLVPEPKASLLAAAALALLAGLRRPRAGW